MLDCWLPIPCFFRESFRTDAPVGMRSVVGILLFAGVCAGGPLPTQGQELQYGFTLGGNWGTMQSPGLDPGRHVAFAGGFVLRQPVAGPLSLQSELLLNQKGVEVESDEEGAIDYGVGYLELPLLIHLKTPSLQSVTVHGEAGGFGAVKLFERQTPGGGGLNVPIRTGVSFYRRINAGIVAGVGATVPIRGQRLNVTVRRAWGLRNVARDVPNQPFSEAPFPPEGKTRTWSFLLRFGI